MNKKLASSRRPEWLCLTLILCGLGAHAQPLIESIYPNGANMFQPSGTLSFTASSVSGINAAGITVQLTVTNLLGQAYVTNLTSANGLVVGGTPEARTVSTALKTNLIYGAAIQVTDTAFASANATVSFDTLNPNYTWESEDFDYGSGQYFDNPQTGAYAGLGATDGIDAHVGNFGNGAASYRPSGLNTEACGDTPLRSAYIGTGYIDYNAGWNDGGNWGNYTRTFPAGVYNIYMRAANGSGGNGSATLSAVTSGAGTATQTTTSLGTFTVPVTGGWQAYRWVPLRDFGGNLAQFSGGAVKTLRITAGGGYNANFYALFPANSDFPVINNLYPNGAGFFQHANTLSFGVTSSAGVALNDIQVTVDGVNVSGALLITGSATNWNVTYPGLQAETNHTATISVTAINANNTATTFAFDTFSSNYFTWEAEDYDYGAGQFFDNPQVNSYAGLDVSPDVDYHSTNPGGAYVYRPAGTATGISTDALRPQFVGFSDYDIGYFGSGEWGNYTRHYPAGTFYVWGRFAAGGGDSLAYLSRVTGGFGTADQTTNFLGTFTVPNAGWASFNWIQLKADGGNPATVTLDAAANTLKLSRPLSGYPEVNVNFLMLVPLGGNTSITLTATRSGSNIIISFPTKTGSSYQLQYKSAIVGGTWLSLGSPLAGNNAIQSVTNSIAGSPRFYRVQIQ